MLRIQTALFPACAFKPHPVLANFWRAILLCVASGLEFKGYDQPMHIAQDIIVLMHPFPDAIEIPSPMIVASTLTVVLPGFFFVDLSTVLQDILGSLARTLA